MVSTINWVRNSILFSYLFYLQCLLEPISLTHEIHCFSGGPLIILVCSLKMLRFAFSDTPRQYLIITFTYFFFKYDFRWSSESFLIDYFFVSIMFCKVSVLLWWNYCLVVWTIKAADSSHLFSKAF